MGHVKYLKFHKAIFSIGLNVIKEDYSVYAKNITDRILILPLYVDDILLTESNMEIINITKQWLSSTFEMNYLGKLVIF